MSAFPRWLGRKAALLAILVLAVTFFSLVWPNIRPGRETLTTDWMSPQQMRDELTSARSAAQDRLEARVESLRNANEAQHQRRLAEATSELAAATDERGKYNGFFDGVRPSRILQKKRLDLRISGLKLEISALKALANENTARNAMRAARLEAQRRSLVPTEAAIRRANQACRLATSALQRFERRWTLDRGWRNVVRDERAQLTARARTTCERAKNAADKRRAGIRAQQAARDAQTRYNAARKWKPGAVESVSHDIPKTVFRNILLKALLLFAAILTLPLLIRCLFYFVLAPMAERRPPIRLLPDDGGNAANPTADPSRTSVSIHLGEGEELLVRQGFLQSTSEAGYKHTQWLLDWRHPLSSVASGLSFLTLIRGTGTRTTVSAVSDPFAEVTILNLARSASCVLHPRALAAVVQRIDEPLKVTRHWRLVSLHAWLTLQLRYLVFHGPAQLVIKGSRGVRIERAESGRIFGQQQLVGFSTHLAYTVRRTETFWPYFLGREQLLKDRVLDGGGVLIVEEAPMTGQRGRGAKRGLEGAFDASLKAFGL